jgi:hypothetical protein
MIDWTACLYVCTQMMTTEWLDIEVARMTTKIGSSIQLVQINESAYPS